MILLFLTDLNLICYSYLTHLPKQVRCYFYNIKRGQIMKQALGQTKMEILRASQLQSGVIQEIQNIRHPDELSTYKEELARYKRRLGKRKEVELTDNVARLGVYIRNQKRRGFSVNIYGEEVPVYRPESPRAFAWAYKPYYGSDSPAMQLGLLANPLFNRDIRPDRVEQYREAMQAGEWHDLLSDPITISNQGQVINGQHRLAAACKVDWAAVSNDPRFLVVFGVDPNEALHADGSRRTDRDEHVIAAKLIKELAA